jgi:hypothetical protein
VGFVYFSFSEIFPFNLFSAGFPGMPIESQGGKSTFCKKKRKWVKQKWFLLSSASMVSLINTFSNILTNYVKGQTRNDNIFAVVLNISSERRIV